MNRRNFLRGIIGAGIGALVVQSLPPPEIMAASPARVITTEELIASVKPFTEVMVDWMTKPTPFWLYLQERGFVHPGEDIIEDIVRQ